MQKITISLPSIHYESCVKIINMTLKNISGIQNKQFDLKKKSFHLKLMIQFLLQKLLTRSKMMQDMIL